MGRFSVLDFDTIEMGKIAHSLVGFVFFVLS